MNKNPSLIEAKVSQPGEDFLTESSKSPASMAFFVKQKALRRSLRAEEPTDGTRTRDLHLGKVAYYPTVLLSHIKLKSDRRDSNPRPPPWQGGVLVPTVLLSHTKLEERQTGLEPATSTLARWRTTNCTTIAYKIQKSDRRDSNPRPPPWQGGVLPTVLLSHLTA